MLERLDALPTLVLVAYAVCLCALVLFSSRLRYERTRLRRALNEGMRKRKRELEGD